MRFTSIITASLLLTLGLSTAQAEKIELIGTLRDFKARGATGGHSDFEDTNDANYPLITGMVKSALSADGKPQINLNSNAGKITSVTVSATKQLTDVKLTFTDNTTYTYSSLTSTSGTFAVPTAHAGKSIKSAGVKVKSSSTWNNINDDADHTGTTNNITATFIPDSGIPRSWRIASENSFKQWYTNVAGVNQSIPYTITLDNGKSKPGGTYRFEASKHNNQSFFPIDGKLMGNEGRTHNYHFTYEIATKFTYTARAMRDADMVFNFSGDDDVWVFINKKLAVDLGGVHGEKYGSINVDSMATSLGLVVGETYDFHFFFAERHTVDSNCTIETTMQFLSPLYD